LPLSAAKETQLLPYFVYRIFPPGPAEHVEQCLSFRDASARAKALRAEPGHPPGCTFKVVFAANEIDAAELLAQSRAPKPGLADDE
jgi:hypothetical protein